MRSNSRSLLFLGLVLAILVAHSDPASAIEYPKLLQSCGFVIGEPSVLHGVDAQTAIDSGKGLIVRDEAMPRIRPIPTTWGDVFRLIPTEWDAEIVLVQAPKR